MTEPKAVKATRKDMADNARDHYDEISLESMWFSSVIPEAIDAWEREPDLQALADSRLELLRECRRYLDLYADERWWTENLVRLAELVDKELKDSDNTP